ncbi:MAG: DUF2309 domain-containing protein [Myxococcota bacterium]
MTQNLAATEIAPTTANARTQRDAAVVLPRRDAALDTVLADATKRIAPLWPLESFVAVNPFLGVSSEPFERACQKVKQVTGATMLMPRAYYRSLVAEGRINAEDLESALALASAPEGAPRDLESLREAIEATPSYDSPSFATAADVLDAGLGQLSNPRIIEDVSKWCAAYWDDGQAAWRMPWRHLPLYKAWRAATTIDRTAEVTGLDGFRAVVSTLPSEPIETIAFVIDALGLPREVLDGYLHRALSSIGGWAAYARYLGWVRELEGEDSDSVTQLLAIRLAWDYALVALSDDERFEALWAAAVETMRTAAQEPHVDQDLAVDAILQGAFDAAFRRETLGKLSAAPAVLESPTRKAVQAAFCIDVRSEVYRRALESVSPKAQTIGFAGFFGFPIEYVSIGQSTGPAQCPVLLTPKFVVREGVAGASTDETTEILGLRLLRRRAAKAWKSFKSSAVSSFVYVETAGLAFAAKLVGDATGLTRTVTLPSADGLSPDVLERTVPEVRCGSVGGRETGFTPDDRVVLAEGALRGMSLTKDFARLVLLAGHGSTTVNNPHAAGYDCGACGGHPGDANARVAAAVLNDAEVRRALRARGIEIPQDTVFVGGLHDTTLDTVTIFDRELVPESHRGDLAEIECWLAEAGSRARAERAQKLNLGSADPDRGIARRGRDWSQVRPEWGLATNAAFIAAPRSRTRGVDLGGRSFLHDYDWRQDEDWGVLELILTAPMVVASWINLQYYGSAVNQGAFGSGNKVLHNVVGTLGVLEGNGGDLRVGLPAQAVHDGARLVHEPVRLNVIVEAPTEQIDNVLDKHDNVRELIDNGWVHLLALGEDGTMQLRRASQGDWIAS